MGTSTEKIMTQSLQPINPAKTSERETIMDSKKLKSFLERWLILRLGQEIHRMSLEHLVLSESKEVLPHTHILMGHVKKGTETK